MQARLNKRLNPSVLLSDIFVYQQVTDSNFLLYYHQQENTKCVGSFHNSYSHHVKL